MSENCHLCEKNADTYKPKCRYINCPYRKKGSPLPVKVSPLERTLWILPQTSSTSNAHKPYAEMFKEVVLFDKYSIIRRDDVLFFDGGTDVDPSFYGEEPHIMTSSPDKERDIRERLAFQRAQAVGAKCLGVCRGAQFLCVLSGGKLVQHVTGHGQGHMIYESQGGAYWSESSHHQVMWPYETQHIIIAYASPLNNNHPFVVSDEYGKEFPDGEFPEIVYFKDTKSLAIQGHAEWLEENSAFVKFTRDLVREFLFEGR